MSKDGKKIKYHGIMLLSNNYNNVPSRYLRETTGSCHDLCKYGRKLDCEQEKSLTFRRFIASSIAFDAAHSLDKDPVDADRKNKLVITVAASDSVKCAELNTHTGSLAKIISLPNNSGDLAGTPEPTLNSMSKVIEIQGKDSNSDRSQINAIVGNEKNTNFSLGGLLLENHSEALDEEIISHSKTSNRSMNKKYVNKPMASVVPKLSLKSSTLREKSSVSADAVWNSKEFIVFETPKVIKQNNSGTCKRSASPKLRSSSQTVFHSPRKTEVSAKSANSLILKSPNASRSLKGGANMAGISNSNMPKIWEIKSLKSRKADMPPTSHFHSATSLKAKKPKFGKHATLKKSELCNDSRGSFHEKILKVVEPKAEGGSLELNQDCLSKERDEHTSEFTERSLNGGIQRKHKRNVSKELEKRRTRTPAVSQSETLSSPYKLKFNRGKVIELQTAENIWPQRLRFRKGRGFGDNTISEVPKKSFRRRDIGDSIDSKLETHDVMMKDNLESKGVKLKHQDLQGKKSMQALFNHVIEETANKLVETRKSKVKALVVAFESVISLQESKQTSAV